MDFFANGLRDFWKKMPDQIKTVNLIKMDDFRKNRKEKNLKRHFGELDELLNTIWSVHRYCINSIYILCQHSFFKEKIVKNRDAQGGIAKQIIVEKKIKSKLLKTRGCPRGVMVKAMAYGIVVSSYSSYAITFTFGQIPLGKVWTPLFSQLWVK